MWVARRRPAAHRADGVNRARRAPHLRAAEIGAARRVSTTPLGGIIDLSPDGTRISLFWRTRRVQRSVLGQPRRARNATHAAWRIYSAVWAPTGETIAFAVRDSDLHSNLSRKHAGGNDPRCLKCDGRPTRSHRMRVAELGLHAFGPLSGTARRVRIVRGAHERWHAIPVTDSLSITEPRLVRGTGDGCTSSQTVRAKISMPARLGRRDTFRVPVRLTTVWTRTRSRCRPMGRARVRDLHGDR